MPRLDQCLSIKKIQNKLLPLIESIEEHSEIKDKLVEIKDDLSVFHDKGIDFKDVVDVIDDSILISDANGVVIYVNPAHEQNTGIAPTSVLGRNVTDIVRDGNLFTGGATLDVIESRKKVFRLSTTYTSSQPKIGYAVGVPLFDEEGALKQVVVSSRPIDTLSALREDFDVFVSELDKIQRNSQPIRVFNEDSTLPHRDPVGTSRMDKLRPLIERAAHTDATVLITGESGVGKEVVADEIVSKSDRKGKPYVKVNCAAIPAALLESELFGYEKGAFSGANAQGKQGLFELANHGTILLDEIGDMPMDMQVKLLRVIQNRQVQHVGGTKPINLDVRFIALTNSDLQDKIRTGLFRSDLYYRLSVIPIQLPPLRNRLEDLPELCSFFSERFFEKYNRHIKLTKRQLDMMKMHSWPGNIRELENVMEYLAICSSGIGEVKDEVLAELLGVFLNKQEDARPVHDLQSEVERLEKELIEKALSVSANLQEAGSLLNVNASTICRKIKKYAISYK